MELQCNWHVSKQEENLSTYFFFFLRELISKAYEIKENHLDFAFII